ncbi:DUF4139 domain-containing protein [Rhodanobacter sp. L36]|uniref:DUF4139 domain-containing protein n=1 Tax=Rhodanobacter sp. L36 TaxID=1747221 RepID=UPI00131ED035|nr:DUF4139 domain-containing protein [Rhodanobacter sp. L36]
MTTSRRTALALAVCGITLGAATTLQAADQAELTLYRSDNAAMYASSSDGNVSDGYAVVREQRSLVLAAGRHAVVIGDLPAFLDPEALALSFPGNDASVLSQRLLLAQGQNAALTGLTGRSVNVLGSGGQSLANGTLLRAGDGLLVRDAAGHTTLVRDFAAVQTSDGEFPTGSSLSLQVDATRGGQASAVLSYPTSGLGWRAAYVATLQTGATCRMQFESRASIANRSGRDWRAIQLTLIAGEPNMAKPSAPRPMMAMGRILGGKMSANDLPQQNSVGDYRSYTLPAAVDLPDGSVSQVPLYASRAMDCERTALFEIGNSFQSEQPMTGNDFNQDGGGPIVSTLKLKAFDSLPAGYLRVLTADRHGTPQFIGEGRINDTPKGSDATITLGTAFDLRATRSRTAFKVDNAGRSMDESFRINLTNAGDGSRTITVREHPNRWRQWTLISSSSKPNEQTPDTLAFRIDVPAHGAVTLDYAVRYVWAANDHPQP